jgi:MFS transporter, YNFM family, putative membrane transport protein
MSSVLTQSAPAVPVQKGRDLTIVAAMIAGACTFLNVYCTQPLLPFLQKLYHASEVEVSLTVGAVTLAVAVMAPLVGMFAENIGRKKVIVPALFGLTVPTLLAATANSLHTLIFWRFAQGLFVPGVICVIMAYINEEFPDRAGSVMASYITGTVFGGFLGRFISGIIATHWNWRWTFLVLGVLNLCGAIAVRQWLPKAQNFVRAEGFAASARNALLHLRNPRLYAVFGMGFMALFSLVGVFTYANFYLAAPPFHLTSAQLGGIFFVYLLGLVVTPMSGRFLDRSGIRKTAALALAFNVAGLALTLLHSLPGIVAGLALFSSGVFISQATATVQTGRVAGRARSSAAGLYVTLYYVGGSLGATVPAWFWLRGGWPACVGLLASTSALSLAFAFLSAAPASISGHDEPAASFCD